MSDRKLLSIAQIKYYRSLQQKKYRNQHNAFLIEGEKMVKEIALDKNSNLEVIKILAANDFFDENSELLSLYDCLELRERDLEKISSLSTSSKVIMELKIPDYSEDIGKMFEGVNIFLESIRDPGNLGTLIRTADWFGLNKVICSPDSVDVYNPKVIQATMGSIARVKVLYMNAAEIFESSSGDSGFQNIATVLKGETINKFKFPERGIIYFGNESNGLSNYIQENCRKAITIPGSHSESGPESLNLSISAGIIMSEMNRQKLIQNGN